jgi:hypothetical protein
MLIVNVLEDFARLSAAKGGDSTNRGSASVIFNLEGRF